MVEDKGARRVQSRGLAFVPRATAAAALEGGPQPALTDVLCCTFEALSQEDKALRRWKEVKSDAHPSTSAMNPAETVVETRLLTLKR